MNLHRHYWIFIAAAIFFSVVASASTFVYDIGPAGFMECNSVSAACFARFGMVPCMLLGIPALVFLMVAIPSVLRQNRNPGLLSVLVLGCIVVHTAFDSVNNMAAILGYHQVYLVAHTVLDTTNNVTGNIVGTGDSLC